MSRVVVISRDLLCEIIELAQYSQDVLVGQSAREARDAIEKASELL